MGVLDDLSKLIEVGKSMATHSEETSRERTSKEPPYIGFKCPCGFYKKWECSKYTPKETTDEIVAHLNGCEDAKEVLR